MPRLSPRKLKKELLALAQALDDPTRIDLMLSLAKSPRRVQDLADGASLSRPTISHHLGIMHRAGVITYEKQGRESIYSTDIPTVCERLADLLDTLDSYDN